MKYAHVDATHLMLLVIVFKSDLVLLGLCSVISNCQCTASDLSSVSTTGFGNSCWLGQQWLLDNDVNMNSWIDGGIDN